MRVVVDGLGIHATRHAVARLAARAGVVDEALAAIPAVIQTARAAGRLEIDLFARQLADVADPQIPRLTVEGDAPGVAQAETPDLVAHGRVTHEGVIGGDAVVQPRVGVVDVHPQQFAQESSRVLPRIVGVAEAAAVAEGDVKITVGPEGQVAGVVVREGLADGHQHLLGIQVDRIGAWGNGETANDTVVVR